MSSFAFLSRPNATQSKAKHIDPAVYNAIKEEEAKLEAEKDELKMQKEVLEDEVDTLQSDKSLPHFSHKKS